MNAAARQFSGAVRAAGAALALLPLTAAGAEPDSEGLRFFERKIRPALVKHCYKCHSATSEEVGGKLLLDSRVGTLEGGESGPALVAGKPEESLLIRAVSGGDDDLVMPPEDEPPLPEAVTHDLVEWVRMGAPDPRTGPGALPGGQADADRDGALWSFRAPSDPAPPEVADGAWPRDPIDRFLLARLETGGHRPAGDAPAEVLIRRLYFDLVGLAPAFEEIAQFEAEHAVNARKAVESLVDRLLASPQFGERWGRHWLDVARYGESNGNDGLGRNPTFPHAWRYRDYVIEAFNRDTPYDRFLREQIAGDLLPASDAAQRNRQLTATGFLAIGAKPAAAMNANFAMDVVDDQIDVVGRAVMGLSVSCARCHDHKHDPIPTRDYYALAGIFKSTETLWGKAANEGLTAPATPLHQLGDSLAPDKAGAPPKFPDNYADSVSALGPVVHARLDKTPDAAAVAIEKGVKFPGKGFAQLNEGRIRLQPRLPADNYSISFWFRNDTPNGSRPITVYLFSHATDGASKEAGDHLGIGGSHDNSLSGKLFFWNGREGQNLNGSRVLPEGVWHHVVMVRAGNRVRVHLNGESEIDGELEVLPADERGAFVGARSDHFAPLEGFLADVSGYDRALTPEEAATLHSGSGQRTGTPQEQFAMGVRDRGEIADCKIHIDGNSKKLGPPVPRGFLSACQSQFRAPTIGRRSSGRLQLADWLTRGDHPQTARVMVNRVWLHLFGRAIVDTPDDFGVYGARPTHPELLDHLATRFMREGWSVKRLIRAIVLTRVYQLDSRGASEALITADPGNILLGRHSRRRLDAESLRDRILQASGTLDPRPASGSAIDELDILINWPPGEAKYLHQPSRHRSVYLCMLRNAPPPELAAFDFPDGMEVAGRREHTTGPGQALFLLNSPFVVEQARELARQLLADGEGVDADRVRIAYRRVLGRDPADGESQRALSHVADLADEFEEEPQLRAWASFCQALLASSEFRYID